MHAAKKKEGQGDESSISSGNQLGDDGEDDLYN